MTKQGWLLIAVGLLAVGLAVTLGRDVVFPAQDRTWQTMQRTGVWRVGLDPSFPPFELLDATGKPVGFDIDLAQSMAAVWGLKTEIVPVGFDSLLDALRTGQVDSVISALPYDERMTEDVAYSSAYYEAGIRLVVRQGSDLRDGTTLANRRLAVELGSMGDMVGRRLQRQHASLHLRHYETPQAVLDALVQDKSIDAVLVDQVTLRTAQGQNARVVAVGPALESNPYVIAMPHAAGELQTQVEATLRQLQQTGALIEIESKWFDETK